MADLLAFNVGVELGQLMALAVILIVMGFWRKSPDFLRQAYTNAEKPSLDELSNSKQLIRSTVIAGASAVAILVTVVLPLLNCDGDCASAANDSKVR